MKASFSLNCMAFCHFFHAFNLIIYHCICERIKLLRLSAILHERLRSDEKFKIQPDSSRSFVLHRVLLTFWDWIMLAIRNDILFRSPQLERPLFVSRHHTKSTDFFRLIRRHLFRALVCFQFLWKKWLRGAACFLQTVVSLIHRILPWRSSTRRARH